MLGRRYRTDGEFSKARGFGDPDTMVQQISTGFAARRRQFEGDVSLGLWSLGMRRGPH